MRGLEAIIDDLESALQNGEQERRIAMLRQVTNLFLDNASRYDAEQVEVFDDVLTHLIRELESKVLAELGEKLAPVANAPNAVMQSLARHDEIAVAGPVLSQSSRLTDNDLVEIARTKGQGHLGAISTRPRLTENVTDVLVERGDTHVVHTLAQNEGAAFSNSGISTLAHRARTDERLAVNLGMRPDVSPAMLQELMAKATEAVRARLVSIAPPGLDVDDTVDAASRQLLREASSPRSMRRAEAVIAEMAAKGQIDEQAIASLARNGLYEETLLGLARLCAAPVELFARLLQNPAHEGLLIACKAADLNWSTVAAVLKVRKAGSPASAEELEAAAADFLRLPRATAQRVFRFWLVRGVVARAS